MEFRPLKRVFTISIPTGANDGEINFPTSLPIEDRCIYGVIGHLNDTNNTRKDINGVSLVSSTASVFVRLEGTESSDSNVLFTPLEALSVAGKNYPYVPINIGKILTANCKIRIGGFAVADANKVVMLTFLTD